MNIASSTVFVLMVVVTVIGRGSIAAGHEEERRQFSYPIEKPLRILEKTVDAPLSIDELTEVLQFAKRSAGQILEHDIVKRSLFKTPKIFSALHNTSQECRAAFMSVGPAVVDIIRGKIPYWIIAMFDSMGKFTSGTMRGSRLRTGSYNQCVRIDVAERPGTSPAFRGQMCTIRADYPKSIKQYRIWELMGLNIYPAVPRLDTFEIQVCVPSVCTEQDAGNIFKKVAEIMEEDLVLTSVRCYWRKDMVFSTWTISVMVMGGIATLIYIIGTSYETMIRFRAKVGTAYFGTPEHDQNVANIKQLLGPVSQSILAFSIPNNLHNTLTADVPDDFIRCISGIRFFSFAWVVVANMYYIGKDMEWKNYVGFLEDLRTTYGQLIINARFAADTMFCISGLLVSLLTLRQLQKHKGKFNIIYFCVHRMLRILPLYMIVMIIGTAIFFHTGEGVTWMKTDEFQEHCSKHWWKGLLFLNNYFPESQKCMPLSWFVAVDFQMYTLAPLFLVPLYSTPKLGLGLLGLGLMLAMAVPGIVTEMFNLPYLIGRKFYFEPNHDDYVNLMLYKAWGHQGPYFIGMLFGYLIYAKGTNITMKRTTVTVGWIIAIAIQLVILLGFRPYIDGTTEMPKILGLMYTCTASTLWAVSYGWIIYACCTGYGGFVDDILSGDFFVSSSKFLFTGFLIQDMVLHNFMDSRPDIYYYDLWIIIIVTTGCVFSIFVTSVLTTTLAYEPIRQLENIWLRNKFIQRSSTLVHFAVAPTSSEDEMDESTKKLISNKDLDDEDDDDMESIPVYIKNTNALGNVDLNKQFQIYQNGADLKNPEESAPLVVSSNK